MKRSLVVLSIIVVPLHAAPEKALQELPFLPPTPPVPLHYSADMQGSTITAAGPLTGRSVKQALTSLEPFLLSRSVDRAAAQFVYLPKKQSLAILTQLFDNNALQTVKQSISKESERQRSDFLQLLFGVAHLYKTEDQSDFFDLIDHYEGLRIGIRPLLFIASISSSPEVLPQLLEWLTKKYPSKKELVRAAGLYGADRSSIRSLHALYTYAKDETVPFLGAFLFEAILKKGKKIKDLIFALVSYGADVNYADPSGYTPLIKAVELENSSAVHALMELGADVDLVVKDDVGSAWQKAGEIKNTALIKYITNYPSKKNKHLSK